MFDVQTRKTFGRPVAARNPRVDFCLLPACHRRSLSDEPPGRAGDGADVGGDLCRDRAGPYSAWRYARVSDSRHPQWIAGIYLGIGGGALAFILWVLALERATPTRVANTPSTRSQRDCSPPNLGKPITANLVAGLGAVFAGIWSRRPRSGRGGSTASESHIAAMASISIVKSAPYSFDTSTSVTAGAAGGVTVAKKRFRAAR
jgi:hypothetical protein